MYKYAEIYAGKVRDLKESNLGYVEFCSIFDPTSFWLDVTGVENIEIGWVIKSNTEVGTYFESPEIPEETLETKKAAKLEELDAKFAITETEAYLTSSLGFQINAGERAYRDIEGLIKLLTAKPEITTVNFCCYDNTEVPVTLADLNTMQIEVILSGNSFYDQKWAYRKAINNALSIKELDAIIIDFTMSDFSVKESEE